MTVVAAGTSLPELVTSIVAARKGETGLAIGNVVGSNIFNIVFILGVSASLHPITVSLASVTDLVLLLAANLLAAVFCSSGGRIGMGEGAAMFALYISDMVFAIVR
jgi:cation:H+ antiporter